MANPSGRSCNTERQKWLFNSQSGWSWQYWTCYSRQSLWLWRTLYIHSSSRQEIHHKEVNFQAQEQSGNRCVSGPLEAVDNRHLRSLSSHWWSWRQEFNKIMLPCLRQSNLFPFSDHRMHFDWSIQDLFFFVEFCWKKKPSMDLGQRKSGWCENPWNHQAKSSII